MNRLYFHGGFGFSFFASSVYIAQSTHKEKCEAAMRAKDEEIVHMKDIVKGLYAHMMNVDEYIPNVRTVFIWKLNITSYEAPLYSPKFYSRLHGHYCMHACMSIRSKIKMT